MFALLCYNLVLELSAVGLGGGVGGVAVGTMQYLLACLLMFNFSQINT